MSPLNANILGYDTLTVLLISLCFSLIYRWDSFKSDKIILLTLLLAVGVFLRLPNVILILVLGFYVLVVENYKKSLMLIFLSLCFILIAYMILYSNSDLLKFSLGQKEHHNPMALLKNYFKDGLQVFGYILLIGSAYYLWLSLIHI